MLTLPADRSFSSSDFPSIGWSVTQAEPESEIYRKRGVTNRAELRERERCPLRDMSFKMR